MKARSMSASVAGIVLALSTTSVWTQTLPGPDIADTALEEVVVTATRREERLQDVPISITAFSQEKLDAQGLKDIDDLARLSPGITFSRNGASGGNYNDEGSDISIRGIDSSAGSSTTGIYIDDTPVQSRHIGFGSVNVFPQLFDLERVEVLRGPQGTLFGAGAEGGALRFITPAPGLKQDSSYVRSEVSTTDDGAPSYELGAAVGGPAINDVLGFRLSASYRRDGGWVDRVNYSAPIPTDPLGPPSYTGTTARNANWQETITARAALLWQVSRAVSISPSIYFQQLHVNDTATYWEALSDPSAHIYRNGNALTNPSIDPFALAAIKVEADLGFAQLVSNTSYFARSQRSVSDYTQFLRAVYLFPSPYPQPGDAGTSPYGDSQHNFYEEVRLASTDAHARVQWNGGLFLERTDENVRQNIIDPTLEAESGGYVCAYYNVACPNGLISVNPLDRDIEKQMALFGEVGLRLPGELKLTVGARVSRIQVSGATAGGGAYDALPLAPLQYSAGSATQTPVTPKASLAWQPDHDDLFYFTMAKGYREGGVNAPVGIECAADLANLGLPIGADGNRHAPASYGSDYLWSYEIGAKNTLFGGRLQINSSLFTVNWRNIQQNVYLGTCGEQFTGNLGAVLSHGGDVAVAFRPTRALSLGMTIGYTDARYTEASCAGALTPDGSTCVGAGGIGGAPIASRGDRLVGAPWTVLTSAEYATPLEVLGGRTLYFRLDDQRTTAQTALTQSLDDRNSSFDTTEPGLPGTHNLSLRAGVRFGGFDVSAFANNVTNDHPLLVSTRDVTSDCVTGLACGAPGAPASTDNLYYGRGVRPRSVGVTVTYRH